MKELNFTAVDFETANNSRNSICQVGICRVENGDAIYSESFLVKPPENEYSHLNILIHGINPDMTVDKPIFPIIWENIKSLFENQLIIAHNASFDIDCLIKTLEYYKIQIPSFNYKCTYQLTGLNLIDLAESLDIEIISHHNAQYDSIACAKAFVKLTNGIQPDLKKITKKETKSIFEGHEHLCGNVLKPDLENADSNSPFYGKKIVFTGVLENITRENAADITKKMGADIDTGVTKRTDFVIIGSGAGPSKLKKIEEYNKSGSNIKSLNETEFLKLIKQGL